MKVTVRKKKSIVKPTDLRSVAMLRDEKKRVSSNATGGEKTEHTRRGR
jgi:hypothetical protein